MQRAGSGAVQRAVEECEQAVPVCAAAWWCWGTQLPACSAPGFSTAFQRDPPLLLSLLHACSHPAPRRRGTACSLWGCAPPPTPASSPPPTATPTTSEWRFCAAWGAPRRAPGCAQGRQGTAGGAVLAFHTGHAGALFCVAGGCNASVQCRQSHKGWSRWQPGSAPPPPLISLSSRAHNRA